MQSRHYLLASVFERLSDGRYEQVMPLAIPQPYNGYSYFGYESAISPDASTIVVSAGEERINDLFSVGAVYTFD